MKFIKTVLFIFVAFVSFNFFSTGNFFGVAKVEAYAFSNTLGSPWPPNPTSAVLGKPLTFTSTLQVFGWTGNSFPGGFEIATGSGGSGTRTVISSNPYPIPAMDTWTSPKTMTSVSYTFNDVVGMHSVRSCVDVSLDQFVNQSDNDGNCSGWVDVILTASPMPDLQAQISGPYNPVTVGDSYPVAAGFANTGTGGVAGGNTGPALVQTALGFDSSGNPTNLVDQKFLYWMNGLNPNESLPLRFDAGGNAISGVPFNAAIKLPASLDGSTFPANNKFYFRVCVDKVSAGDSTGIISESNENNNCTGWYSQIVCPIGTIWNNACIKKVITINVTADTSPVAYNGSTLIKWSSTNATSCTLSGGGITGSGTSNNSGVTTGSLTSSKTYSVSCDGDNGLTGNSSVTVSVTQPSFPDLQVGVNVTPTATIAGDTTFSATIKNNGTVTTGAGFTNLFQTATSIVDLNNPTGLLKYEVPGMTTLAPSATAVTSKTLTLAVGKIYIRACADNNISMVGTINEGTNEGNNCSEWVAVTVGSPSTNCTDATAQNRGFPLPCFYNPAFCKIPTDPNYGKAACTVDPCGGNGATNPPLCTVKCK